MAHNESKVRCCAILFKNHVSGVTRKLVKNKVANHSFVAFDCKNLVFKKLDALSTYLRYVASDHDQFCALRYIEYFSWTLGFLGLAVLFVHSTWEFKTAVVRENDFLLVICIISKCLKPRFSDKDASFLVWIAELAPYLKDVRKIALCIFKIAPIGGLSESSLSFSITQRDPCMVFHHFSNRCVQLICDLGWPITLTVWLLSTWVVKH